MRLVLLNDAGTEVVGVTLDPSAVLELGVELVREAHDRLRRDQRGTVDMRARIRGTAPVQSTVARPPDQASATISVPQYAAPAGETQTFALNPVADAIRSPVVPCPGPSSCLISADGSRGNWSQHHHRKDGQTVIGPAPAEEDEDSEESA